MATRIKDLIPSGYDSTAYTVVDSIAGGTLSLPLSSIAQATIVNTISSTFATSIQTLSTSDTAQTSNIQTLSTRVQTLETNVQTLTTNVQLLSSAVTNASFEQLTITGDGGAGIGATVIITYGLPTIDPHVAGQLYYDPGSGNVIRISLG